jgi:hypothetical protein
MLEYGRAADDPVNTFRGPRSMTERPTRRYSVGSNCDDLCRACKLVRRHTITAMGGDRILRVLCDYCGSQHNYRGPRAMASPTRPRAPGAAARPASGGGAFPTVSERERRYSTMSDPSTDGADLELLLRRIIREETGLTPVTPADKWHGGTLTQKIVMLRNRLRTMEQQINAADIPNELKLKLQGYLTGCYGTLTSFNVLFADEDDRFKGAGGK